MSTRIRHMHTEPSVWSPQAGIRAEAPRPAVRWDVVTDDATLAALEAEWRRLLAVTPLASGFQSFAWLTTCRAALPRRAARLLALVVRDDSEPVAILPTELGAGGRLRLIGDVVSNYLGPVYRPERVHDLVDALAAWLVADGRVRLLDFRGLREGSPFVDALCSRPVHGWSESRIVRTSTCPTVDLSVGWEALRVRRTSKRRSNDARKWRALERFGHVEYVEVIEPGAIELVLPTMFRLFRERWRGRHESAGFAGRFREFHERAAPALAAAGHLKLSLLKVDGEVVAFSYGVRAGAGTSGYVVAHDDRVGICSPGRLLLLRLFEAAVKRGDPEYDFSLGEEAYKSVWATGTRGVFRVLRWRRRSRAAVTARAHALGSRAWVAARSIGWLRTVRREGVRRLVSGTTRTTDGDGLWNVYRVARRHAGGAARVARAPTFREMTRDLSPPSLLRLAADRCFRGDALLLLYAGASPLGVVWRAASARRSLVTGGRDVGAAEVYYHPVPAAGRAVGDVVRALADIADGPAEFVLVARERLTDGVGLEVAPISPGRPR